jgi:tetratricopeptide (TPR) repeat protein
MGDAAARQILWTFVLVWLGTARGWAADAIAMEEQRQGCCRYDGTEIAQLHKNADRLYAQFRPRDAASELSKILQLDSRDVAALVKLARAHIDIGDAISEQGTDWKEKKLKEYTVAEDFARTAVKIDPNSTWSHFWVAASVGSIAVVSPISKQVELAGEIRDEVERSLALDPKNGSAYHIYGVWHRKVAEIGGASRMLASVFFGRSPPQGSLGKSIEYLKKAVALNPQVIISRLELARSYIAKEEWALAREQLQSIPVMRIVFSDDAKHKQRAEQLLAEIRDR